MSPARLRRTTSGVALFLATLATSAVAAGCGGPAAPGREPAPGSEGPAASARPSPSATATGESPAAAAVDVPPELEPALAGTPRRPGTPAQAAAMVASAQRVIRSTDPDPDLLAAAGHTGQLAVREVAARDAWLPRVVGRLAARDARWLRENVAARREFRSMHPSAPGDLADELPAWRIVRPPPAKVLLRSYREAERRYGVDWEYLAAINLVETAFGRIRGTSSAGAQGPMQFIPTTWDIYGEGGDINDPHDAILAAGRLLSANGFARDKGAALWRYNNSWAYVRGVTRHAEVIRRDPAQLHGYLAWEVYYLTRRGSVWLPEGYDHRRPVPVSTYLAAHPERLP